MQHLRCILRVLWTLAAPPFAVDPSSNFSLMLSMLVTWSILAVLVLPELVFAVIGFTTGQVAYGWISLALGTVPLIIGVRVGGETLDRREPELLAQLRRQKQRPSTCYAGASSRGSGR